MDDGDSFTYHAYLYNENNGFLESCYKNLITNDDTRDWSSESMTVECDFDYFENYDPSGKEYTFRAYVDKNDYIDESNESNNYAQRNYTIGDELNVEPDLEITSIYLQDTASNVQKGDTITTKSYISITWMDDGDSFTYHAYLYNENNGFLESCYKNLITNDDTRDWSSESMTVECDFDYFENYDPSGKEYTFRAYVDKNDYIDESNESNNYAQRKLYYWWWIKCWAWFRDYFYISSRYCF